MRPIFFRISTLWFFLRSFVRFCYIRKDIAKYVTSEIKQRIYFDYRSFIHSSCTHIVLTSVKIINSVDDNNEEDEDWWWEPQSSRNALTGNVTKSFVKVIEHKDIPFSRLLTITSNLCESDKPVSRMNYSYIMRHGKENFFKRNKLWWGWWTTDATKEGL